MPIFYENSAVPTNPNDAGPWPKIDQIPGSTGSTVYDRDGFEWKRDTSLNHVHSTWGCLARGILPGSTSRRDFGPFTNERKEPMASTRIDRSGVKARIAELTEELLAAQNRLLALTPDEPAGQGTVVRFLKYNQHYTYAALRVGDEWYLTQNPTRAQDRRAPKTWAELLEFVGERNWDSIAVLS